MQYNTHLTLLKCKKFLTTSVTLDFNVLFENIQIT